MSGLIKKVVLGTALAASTVAAVAPAEAQYYRRHRGGDATGAAIVGGIIGLGVGAAIASSNNRDRYYDRGRSYDRGYAYDQGYYNQSYYNDGYNYQPRNNYYNDYRRSYRPRCYIERQYDQWNGRVYNVRVCR